MHTEYKTSLQRNAFSYEVSQQLPTYSFLRKAELSVPRKHEYRVGNKLIKYWTVWGVIPFTSWAFKLIQKHSSTASNCPSLLTICTAQLRLIEDGLGLVSSTVIRYPSVFRKKITFQHCLKALKEGKEASIHESHSRIFCGMPLLLVCSEIVS